MSSGKIAELTRRGIIAVGGGDAEKFLNDLVTSDVPKAEGAVAFGGLLSPQGKVLFDFLVFREGDRYLFDLPWGLVADFVKRLTFYRLRAKVEIAPLTDHHAVAVWGNGGSWAADPRLATLGNRIVVAGPVSANATEADYDAHRIALGIPEGGVDFAFGDAFPHDADMDQFAGVDFAKGCYVGQEVVSRMEHRGTARRRFVLANASTALPAIGTPITAGEKAIGTLGSSTGGTGLALVRLDRAKDAMDHGVPITAGGVGLTLTLPPWAKFGWPATVAAED
jgi:tRNA-modifying protein YgfZ